MSEVVCCCLLLVRECYVSASFRAVFLITCGPPSPCPAKSPVVEASLPRLESALRPSMQVSPTEQAVLRSRSLLGSPPSGHRQCRPTRGETHCTRRNISVPVSAASCPIVPAPRLPCPQHTLEGGMQVLLLLLFLQSAAVIVLTMGMRRPAPAYLHHSAPLLLPAADPPESALRADHSFTRGQLWQSSLADARWASTNWPHCNHDAGAPGTRTFDPIFIITSLVASAHTMHSAVCYACVVPSRPAQGGGVVRSSSPLPLCFAHTPCARGNLAKRCGSLGHPPSSRLRAYCR